MEGIGWTGALPICNSQCYNRIFVIDNRLCYLYCTVANCVAKYVSSVVSTQLLTVEH